VHLLRPKRPGVTVEVLLASALEGTGVPEAWALITTGVEQLRANGALAELRGQQAVAWMWDEVREALLARALGTPSARALADELQAEVAAQRLTPGQAAARLLGEG
jgi:LAO/AO transport system kinase